MAEVKFEINKDINNSRWGKLQKIVIQNIVTIIFVMLAIAGIMLSELSVTFIANELITRITRNLFLVLSLIIPIIAGIGLNFGIVVGAMAGQMALIAVTYWGISGIPGFALCVVVATPIAILFGYLTGKLYNNTKGQEMIAGLILGYFANGIYQFIFLFLAGNVIPMKDSVMIKPDGIGLRNTIALNGDGVMDGANDGIKYAIDGIIRFDLSLILIIFAVALILLNIYRMVRKKGYGREANNTRFAFNIVIAIVVIIGSLAMMFLNLGSVSQIGGLKIPVVTWLIIALLCLFTVWILKTKLGQDFRTIGQSQHIGKVAGINVNRTRIIAVIISTVLAAWGQIILLQNIGTMNTYGSHRQVGMFSVAAILIGGASVSKANIKHAILGVILFQSVFIVSPTAGKTLFGDAQIGEFFRAFVVYFVIGLSLGLHAWKKRKLQNI
ncbi:ABC transporter permease subunit [Vallitalea okinawensis]|uniref:ABC transporter permease subunit n=1 Tax=Vallitalea okinawensis TaxID=2078660 RepID=UPI000CFC8C14|nr:ABC transporter permease [Vallitalea okinawensis]